eukprot:219021-Chlamydomonas_euryale.AAC.2
MHRHHWDHNILISAPPPPPPVSLLRSNDAPGKGQTGLPTQPYPLPRLRQRAASEPASQWCVPTGSGVSRQAVVCPHRQWHVPTGGGVSPQAVVCPHRQGHDHPCCRAFTGRYTATVAAVSLQAGMQPHSLPCPALAYCTHTHTCAAPPANPPPTQVRKLQPCKHRR